ncbi:MAG TPA: hypothetical protein VFR17_11175 [Mycobacterium sp.]|nr:hypothetical protein [Mycobacterium sp.]
MGALTSPKTYVALAVFHAVDAVLCAIPIPQVEALLDDLRLYERKDGLHMGWALAVVKTMAAVGLASVYRFPGLARLTTAMLTLYFAIAICMHVRTFDRASSMTRLLMVLAAGFLAACAAMTVKGPDRHTARSR